jgi:hypothetical protein
MTRPIRILLQTTIPAFTANVTRATGKSRATGRPFNLVVAFEGAGDGRGQVPPLFFC